MSVVRVGRRGPCPQDPLRLYRGVWPDAWWQWFITAITIWIAYEVLRAVVVGAWRRGSERRVDHFLRTHRIPHDPFRHTHRVVVKELVLADPGLVEAMAQRAREEGTDLQDVRRRVRAWLDEIVPQFNLFAYYRVGYALARFAAYSVYHVRLDKESLQRAQDRIPGGASVVYVSNHRSNADFVVTGFMLSKSVQVSYAVGEWARVWPLERLFKSFGSYFVRRGEKDPLYHRTLEAYIQLITKQGVTQAIFPEGGLSRDGALRPAKLGLLDSMTRTRLDPDFRRPLVFVPVGINFDRVLEDENLVYEALHGHQRYRDRTFWQKTWRLLALTGKGFVGGPVNLVRFARKRLKKHGVVAIHFGEPVFFDDWYRGQDGFLDDGDRHTRWDALRPFADDLMDRIAKAIPVTPVTLACRAARRIGRDPMADGVEAGVLVDAMQQEVDLLRTAGAPFALDPYNEEPEPVVGRQPVRSVSDALDRVERLRRTLDLALDVASRRGILEPVDGRIRSRRWDLVEYYANSLCHDRLGDRPVPTGPVQAMR